MLACGQAGGPTWKLSQLTQSSVHPKKSTQSIVQMYVYIPKYSAYVRSGWPVARSSVQANVLNVQMKAINLNSPTSEPGKNFDQFK
jgi:hypothetical protein